MNRRVERLGDLLPTVVADLAASREHAVWCASAHPLMPTVMCRRLTHSDLILHRSDCGHEWRSTHNEQDR